MKVKRHASGSVRYDKRRKTWNYLWYDGPTRRSRKIGTKAQYPTKSEAWAAAERIAPAKPQPKGDTLHSLILRYEEERMPKRLSTRRVYRSFLENHILPTWGEQPITALQPRPVELWLRQLPLSPKSKTHVRSLLNNLMEFAMWAGIIPIERNPISLVQNRGATTKVRASRSLDPEEFQRLAAELKEPYATIAFVSVCLGLRISEALALRWSDVDWLGSRITVIRGIVNQHVDDVKTQGSRRTLELSPDLTSRLRAWKQTSSVVQPEDWLFPSPLKGGAKPYSYAAVWREMTRASKAAGLGHISSHAMRHSFRSWLDAAGTKISVQQKMMRHSDIRTTMNIYGDVVTGEEKDAAQAVSKLAFS